MNTKLLVDEAISLPVEERAFVVDALLCSLNGTEPEIDAEWAKEAQRRLAGLKSGSVEAIPGEEVFSKVWERLQK